MGYGLTRTPSPHGRFATPSRVARQVLPDVCPLSQGRSQPRRRWRSSAIETLWGTIGPTASTTPQRDRGGSSGVPPGEELSEGSPAPPSSIHMHRLIERECRDFRSCLLLPASVEFCHEYNLDVGRIGVRHVLYYVVGFAMLRGSYSPLPGEHHPPPPGGPSADPPLGSVSLVMTHQARALALVT